MLVNGRRSLAWRRRIEQKRWGRCWSNKPQDQRRDHPCRQRGEAVTPGPSQSQRGPRGSTSASRSGAV